MGQAKTGDTVKVHFQGKLDDGQEFGSTLSGDPVQVTLGENGLMPVLEQALIGMDPGQSKTVQVGAEDAFGPYIPDLVHRVERAQVPPDIELAVGEVLEVVNAEGDTIQVTVIELTDAEVALDANHPLAGEDLTYVLQLVEIV